MTVNPVELLEKLIVLDGIVVKSLFDVGAKQCFISYAIYRKYFSYKMLRFSCPVVNLAPRLVCVNKGLVDLEVDNRSVKRV